MPRITTNAYITDKICLNLDDIAQFTIYLPSQLSVLLSYYHNQNSIIFLWHLVWV